MEKVEDAAGADISRLLDGFEALMLKVDQLVTTNGELKQRIQDYRREVRESSSIDGASGLISKEQKRSTGQVDTDYKRDISIAPGIEAWRRLKDLRARRAREEMSNSATANNHEVLEHDFTTPGAQGELKCPFAENAAAQRLRRLSNLYKRPQSLPTPPHFKEQHVEDPIAADFHIDNLGSPPPSAHGSATKCPIRFLDDHSPEEMAKYFEKHKHEIPRSHEVCVKRYQSNAESIRQLDAKYGNLVNMIQGLGVKHQPMLASGEADGKSSAGPPRRPSEKVEQWAEKCDSSVPPPDDEYQADEITETRTSHFERPLQPVRLGESPSRPWGIQVPLDKQTAASADAPDTASNAAQSIPPLGESSVQRDPVKASSARCPFGYGPRGQDFAPEPTLSTKTTSTPALRKTRSSDGPTQSKSQATSGITFNGPVFFGYPADSVGDMLNALKRTGQT